MMSAVDVQQFSLRGRVCVLGVPGLGLNAAHLVFGTLQGLLTATFGERVSGGDRSAKTSLSLERLAF